MWNKTFMEGSERPLAFEIKDGEVIERKDFVKTVEAFSLEQDENSIPPIEGWEFLEQRTSSDVYIINRLSQLELAQEN